jgi:hypothetical protein
MEIRRLKILKRNLKRVWKSFKCYIGLLCIYFRYTDFVYSFIGKDVKQGYRLRLNYYCYCKKQNIKSTLKRVIILFFIINFFGALLANHIAEQNKHAYYEHLKTKAEFNDIYKLK